MSVKKGKRLNKESKELFVYVAFLVILLLTVLNIDTFTTIRVISSKIVKNRVLGAQTNADEDAFWQNFLDKNPSYIPGWIETGQTEKAKEIDPNYTSN